MKSLIWAVAIAPALPAAQSAEAKVYPGWKDGELEIHHIYTGRGSC